MRYTRLGRGRMSVILALMLFVSVLAPVTAFAAPAQHNEGNTEWVQVYTVERGDTLAGIAWSFGLSEEDLLEANSLRNPNLIYVGQQLIIPEESHYGTGGPECAKYYTVRRGDTLSEIALYNGIDEYALARANGIYDLNDVYVGQDLCIPGNGGGNEYPNEYPQEPQRPNYEPSNDGCNPCGQPQNDGPQNDGPKNDGPQRPADEPQRPNYEPNNDSCNPCDQPQNDGPKNDGPQRPADEPQRPNYEPNNDSCNPCDQPQNDGPKNDGPNNDGPQRPADEPQRPNNDGCDPCDGPRRPDYDESHDEYKPEPLRPTEYWKGSYFKDKYFGEFGFERQDLEVNFNWFTGSPFGNENENRFSVRWEKVEYFKGGPYRFYATADDGVRVYVDDQLIIDAWVIQPATDYKADLNLGEGPHKIVVEYYEEAEDAQIRVYWEPRRHNK